MSQLHVNNSVVFLQLIHLQVLYIYIYIYEKKLLKVKPQAEVLAFGAYVFESLQSFNNSLSQVKAHSMFPMSNLQLICQNCRTSTISIRY